MKWATEWHGIRLIAETEQDEHLLEQLHETLPEKAEKRYEDGDRKLYRGEDGKLILEFDR